MAWHERDYNRQTSFGGGMMARMGSHSMVTWLLGINFAVFVIDMILRGGSRTLGVTLFGWGNFNIEQAFFGLQLWRVVTYQFLHLGFWHLLFNMIGLFFFGPMLEQWWGSRRFLAFYLLCGISGAGVMAVLALVPGLLGVTPATPLVGASGSIFGILAGAATLFPHQRVMLIFPPIPMSMRTMARVFLGIAAFSLLAGTPNAAGEAAHLGGALLGFVLVKSPRVLDWADRIPGVSGGGGGSVSRWKQQYSQNRQQRQRERRAAEEGEVDRILDKVKEHGLHSLTRGEKKILSRATERHRRTG